jgi:hypothetical protein
MPVEVRSNEGLGSAEGVQPKGAGEDETTLAACTAVNALRRSVEPGRRAAWN